MNDARERPREEKAMTDDTRIKMNLSMFDEGGSEAGEPGTEAAPDEIVEYGKPAEAEQPSDPPEQPDTTKEGPESDGAETQVSREAEFERLIKGEYKDLFGARVQAMIDQRFKGVKQAEEVAGKAKPIFDMLAQKYGVDARDLDALTTAISDDDSYFEEEALERGIPVTQLKKIKRIERENAEFKRQMEDNEKRQRAMKEFERWDKEAVEVKKLYPGFDLNREIHDPEFFKLLTAGVDVGTAYVARHHDEITTGAMAITAKKVAKNVTDGIRARGARPIESGAMPQNAPVVRRKNLDDLTPADFDEISRRVARGEKISF